MPIRMEERGTGITMNIIDFTISNLVKKIKTILESNDYYQRANHIAAIGAWLIDVISFCDRVGFRCNTY